MRTVKHSFQSLGAALLLSAAALSSAVAQPLPLPELQVNNDYVFGMPGGNELRCTVLAPPSGEWVRCVNKTTRKELWINLGAILYIVPGHG